MTSHPDPNPGATEGLIEQIDSVLRWACDNNGGAEPDDHAHRGRCIAAHDALVQSGGYRPGVFRCAKCGLRSVTVLLDPANGRSEGAHTADCPNECGPAWPVTWKDDCLSAEKELEEACERLAAAERELGEARKALEPFAKAGDAARFRYGCSIAERLRVARGITSLSDFAEAARALASITKEESDDAGAS